MWAGSCRMERWSSARQKNRVSDWGNKQNLDRSKNPHACGWGSRLRDELESPREDFGLYCAAENHQGWGGKIIMGIQRITLQGCASWGWRQRPRFIPVTQVWDNKALTDNLYNLFTYSLECQSSLGKQARAWKLLIADEKKNRIVFFFFSCKLIYCLRRVKKPLKAVLYSYQYLQLLSREPLKMKWGHT